MSAEQGKDSRRWWALAAVSLAAFMTYLDNNIVNVAIPTIQRSLHLSVSGLEWVVSSYLLTLAGLLPYTPSLSLRFHFYRPIGALTTSSSRLPEGIAMGSPDPLLAKNSATRPRSLRREWSRRSGAFRR